MIIKRSAYYRATSASLLRANSPRVLNFSSSGIPAIGLKRCNEQYEYIRLSLPSFRRTRVARISAFLSGKYAPTSFFLCFFNRRNNCRIRRKIEGVYGLSASLLYIDGFVSFVLPCSDTRELWTKLFSFFFLFAIFWQTELFAKVGGQTERVTFVKRISSSID